MAGIWYYADSQNQQRGPVDDAWLITACRSGKLNAATLVWRDGLASWSPLKEVLAELGLTSADIAPPPNAVAAPVAGEVIALTKPQASGTRATGLIVALICLLVFGGVFLALVVPAYQDFAVRSKVASAVAVGAGLQPAVWDFYQRAHRCPTNRDEGFFNADHYEGRVVSAIQIAPLDTGQCAIQIAMQNIGVNVLADKTVQMTMDSQGTWTTTGDLPARYLPSAMR